MYSSIMGVNRRIRTMMATLSLLHLRWLLLWWCLRCDLLSLSLTNSSYFFTNMSIVLLVIGCTVGVYRSPSNSSTLCFLHNQLIMLLCSKTVFFPVAISWMLLAINSPTLIGFLSRIADTIKTRLRGISEVHEVLSSV